MFCPKCAEIQLNETTQYCRKCGFNLENLMSFVETNGELNSQTSLRQKGMRRGVKLILLSVILFPIYVFLAPMFPPNDVLVESSPSNTWFEQISWAIMTTLFLVGIVRIAFAFMFENHFAKQKSGSQNNSENVQKSFKASEKHNALPPSQVEPVSNLGKWKTTGELFEPIFVKRKTSGELK
ncbi:MAG: zinc ribbon domain-containing protein [Acidobacteria bacterium]|nr:zinc ribbon domain-containing protein [Acidobacteriota bacterium]